IWDNEDVYDLRSVETEFPAIVFNDTLTSKATLSCEPTVSSLNDNEIDFRISFDESDDEDYTIYSMAGEDEFHDDNPPPPPPVPPTQQATPHTLSTIKLPILKKVQVSTDTKGQIRVLPPKTTEEILARERERKARTTLLMSIPEDHLAKFHKMTDIKEMWEAIKSRFGGNDESKKMQKYILKQQFESFSISNSEGLHKGYDRVFESDVKGSTASSSGTQNVAFVSSESTSSTNDVITAYGVSTSSGHNSQKEGSSSYTDKLKYSFFANQSSGRKLQFDVKEPVGFDKTKVEYFNCHNTGHFTREYISKGNQESRRRDAGNTGYKTGHVEYEQENFALMAYSNSSSNTEVTSCSKECEEPYAKLKKLYDEKREQLGDASIEIQAYTQALKKVEAQLVCHQQNQLVYEEKIRFMKIDLDDKTNVLTYHKKLLAEAVKEKEELKTKLENFQSSSKGLSKLLNSQMSAKDKSGLGYGDQIHEGVLSYENEVLESVFDSGSSDVEDSPVYDRFEKVEGMHAVPPPMTGIYMPPKSDFGIDDVETLESMPKLAVNKPKAVSKPKVWSDAPIIEEFESDNDDDYVIKPSKEQEKTSFAFVNIVKHVKTPKEIVKEQNTYSPSPKADKRDWNGLMSKKLGLGYGLTKKACFVCGSFNHLIRDCDIHEKRIAKQVELNKQKGKGTGQGENRPVWNNVQRLNHQNKFVPKAVLTKTSIFPINAARQNLFSQAAATSTFWSTATARTSATGETNSGVTTLPNSEIFEQLALWSRTCEDEVIYEEDRVVLSDEEEVSEDPSKWGRSLIEELDLDAEISLVPLHDAEIQEKISDDTKVLLEEEEIAELVEEPTKLVEDQGSGEKGTAVILLDLHLISTSESEKRKDKGNDPSIIRYHALQNRPRSVAEVRKNMLMYLKNQGGYKMKDFKGMSYDDIRPIFEKVWDQVHSFVPMDSEEEVQRLKRTDELSQEQLNQMVIIVLDEGINVEALQTKYPIIRWEFYTMQFWKIIRVGNYTEMYQVFEDMLKNFDRDDLVKLWSLVQERYNSSGLTEDKEIELWVELKMLFEPDAENLLELQKYMHDPLKWWLYDMCAVHHVSTEKGQDIFMLVEKDYPLTKGLATLMLCNKLRVDQQSEMADELLIKIYHLSSNRQGTKVFGSILSKVNLRFNGKSQVNTGSPKLSTARPKLSTDSTKIESMKLEAMVEERRIFKCWFHYHTTNGHQFTMSNRHQELASPEQTAPGKDFSNSLMADSLPKTIWLSTHHALQ
ncbi:hypothetical protein Tco_0562212, partial [Tanacetum coccineum]